MKKRKVKGSFTVYFSILAASFVMLFCILLLAERIVAARIGGRQILDLCASSALGGYCRPLQERYGLLAVESQEVVQEDLEFFLKQHLALKDLQVGTDAVLTDPAVYEEQLERYMEYRFPVALISQYTEILESLKDGETVQKAVLEEMNVSELMQQYNQYFSEFVTLLDGIEETGTRTERCVKNFWNKEWEQSVYETLLMEAKEDGVIHEGAIEAFRLHIDEYIGVVDECLEQWILLCEEGQTVQGELQRIQREADSDVVSGQASDILEALHTGTMQDEEIRKALVTNKELLQKAKEGLRRMMEEKEPLQGLEDAEGLLQYSEQIYVEYELRSMKNGRSWSGLWNEMQEYVTDLSQYVSDADLLDSIPNASLPSALSESLEDQENEELWKLPRFMEDTLEAMEDLSLQQLYNVEYLTGLFWNLSELLMNEEGKEILSIQGEPKEIGFFRAGVEYVICGSGNEMENCKVVRNRILTVRMICNVLHLLTDQEKQNQIRAAASLTGGIIAPGVGDTVLSGIITAVWAAVESYTDYEQLLRGEKVPFMKSAESWQTDLEHVWDTGWEEDRQENGDTGLSYSDYLKLLLLLIPKNTIEGRTQDLIQLALMKDTGKTVSLSTMVTSFHVQGEFEAYHRSFALEGDYGY